MLGSKATTSKKTSSFRLFLSSTARKIRKTSLPPARVFSGASLSLSLFFRRRALTPIESNRSRETLRSLTPQSQARAESRNNHKKKPHPTRNTNKNERQQLRVFVCARAFGEQRCAVMNDALFSKVLSIFFCVDGRTKEPATAHKKKRQKNTQKKTKEEYYVHGCLRLFLSQGPNGGAAPPRSRRFGREEDEEKKCTILYYIYIYVHAYVCVCVCVCMSTII